MAQSIRIGLIGGTGLGDALLEGVGATGVERRAVTTPFGPPSSPVLMGRLEAADIAIIQRHGAGHVRNPAAVPARANIFALKSVGCTHVLASGATGSLREEIEPGQLVICDQLIDRTDGRSRTFYTEAAVHVEFGEPFCPVMRRWLLDGAAGLQGVTVHDRGTYVCMEGPSFSTQAESHMHRQWGAHVVGMTALPEARLAREAELAYALIALPTDYDCWRPRDVGAGGVSLLEEIIGNLQRATQASIDLITTVLRDVSMLLTTPSPAHTALDLAIWSDKTAIPREEIDRLAVLWGRHFEDRSDSPQRSQRGTEKRQE